MKDTYSDFLTVKNFLSFLKYQVKGIFDNNFNCNHLLCQNDYCCYECIQEIIKNSNYQENFQQLYNWFKTIPIQETPNQIDNQSDYFFLPIDIVKCFESINNYLTPIQLNYFCSPWLDGILGATIPKFNTKSFQNIVYNIFQSLCLQGYLETLQWFYECVKHDFVINKTRRQHLFLSLCKIQATRKQKTTPVLWWLLSLKILDQLDVHAYNEKAFRTACVNGNFEVIKLLLDLEGDRRINVHADNEGAFRWACCNGHLEIVKLLLDLEGDRRIDVHAEDEWAFRKACETGNLEIVKLLLDLDKDRKINVNINNDEAFQTACGNKKLDVIRLLLELKGNQKINVHAGDEWAFRYACVYGNTEVVKILLSLEGDRRINVNINNDEAFRKARKNGHLEIENLLVEYIKDKITFNFDGNKYYVYGPSFMWS